MKTSPRRALLVAGVILCAVLVLKGSSLLVPSGNWAPEGTMATARLGASAALLADGRILITGGDAGTGAVTTADFFNADGTISAAPAMSNARSGHISVTLKDGRVLVAGGITAGGSTTSTAEIFDPTTNSWTAIGVGMVEARSGATAAVLSDGRVLVAGGQNGNTISSSIEIFDPALGVFSSAGMMSSPRTQHAVTVLQDGRVLIVGGFNGSIPVASTDIFDPLAGTMGAGPNLAAARFGHSATTLLNGQVVVIGGNNGNANPAQMDATPAEMVDFTAATPAFTTIATNLATPREGHLTILLPNNNNILIVGGTSAGAAIASAEQFTSQESAQGAWTYGFGATGALTTARSRVAGSANQLNAPSSTMQRNGVVMIAGGNDTNGNALNTTEAYGYPTVQTDQSDYPPGTLVTISGRGFQPGEPITIQLVESPLVDTHGPYTVQADANGNFTDASFTTDLHDVNVRFYLTATGATSGFVAQNTFTDANNFEVSGSVTDDVTGSGLSGATVKFFTNSGLTTAWTPTASTTTNSSGGYDVTGVKGVSGGILYVSVTAPTNFTASGAVAGTSSTVVSNSEISTPDGSNGGISSGNNFLLHHTTTSETVAASNASATYSASNQNVTLTATVMSSDGTVADGQVTFTVKNGANTVGSPVSGPVTGGSASATYVLPGGTAVNSYTIQGAYFTAAGGNADATDSTHTLTVSQATPTITFATAPTPTYLGGNFTVSATTTNTDSATLTYSQVSGPCALVSGATFSSSGAGTCVVQASGAATTNFLAASSTQNVAIAKATPAVTFGTAPTPTYLGGNFTVSATTTNTDSATLTYSQVSGPCALVSGATFSSSGAGTCVVQASGAATTNFLAASSTQNVTIAKATPTVTFGTAPTPTYLGGNFTVSATTTNTDSTTLTYSQVSGPCAFVSGATFSSSGAGTCVVKASGVATTNFLAVSNTQNVTIAKAAPTLSVTNSPTYTGSPQAATVSAGSVAGIVSNITYNGSATVPTNAATYTITADFTPNDSTDYNSLSGASAGSFVIQKATPTVTFGAAPTPTYLGGNFTLSATTTNTDSTTLTYSYVSGPCAQASGGTFSSSGAGTCVVKASGAATANFTAASATQSVTIAQATPTVTFGAPPTPTYLGGNFTVNATTTNTDSTTLTYSQVSGPCALVSGATFSSSGAGTCEVQATGTATTNFLAASSTQSVTIGKATPQFNSLAVAPSSISYGTASVTVSGKINLAPMTAESVTTTLNGVQMAAPLSGNPNNFSATFDTHLLPVSVLAYTITISYPGDTNFKSVTDMSLTLTVAKVTPTVNWPTPAAITYNTALGGTQLNATFTASFNGGTVTVAGTPTYNPASGTVLNAGAGQTLSVNFGPTDTTDYNNANGSVLITVNKANTSTAVVSSLNPSFSGQSVTFTATVSNTSGTSATPTGFVQFMDGASALGLPQPLNGAGKATLATSSLSVATHSITAVYTNSDGNFTGSTSAALLQVVKSAATTTTASNATATFSAGNQTVALSATVTSSGGTVNEGIVTFTVKSGAVVIGTAVSGNVSSGSAGANYTLPGSTGVGAYTIDAEYTDVGGNFTASGDTLHTLTVTGTPPSITTSASTAFTAGMAGSFTVMTSGTPTPSLSDGGVALPGTVTFTDNGNGTATLAGTATAAGSYQFTITAHNGVNPDATQLFTLTINAGAAASISVVSGSGQTATVNTAFTNPFVALVQDAYGNAVPSVTVMFAAPGGGPSGTFANATNTAMTNAGGMATSATFTANNTAGNYMVSASAPSVANMATFSLTNAAGSFAQLQLLLPGETPAPGTDTGKTGTPNTEYVNGAFTVTINAVDQYWNLVDTITDTVQITSNDSKAKLPSNAGLVAGTGTFSVELETVSYNPATTTITASDGTDGTKTATRSPVITVIVVYTATITPTMTGTGVQTTYTLTVNNFAAPNTNTLRGVTVAVPQFGGTPSNVTVTASQADSTPANWTVDLTHLPGAMLFAQSAATDGVGPGGNISIQFTATATNSISGTTTQNVWPTTAYSDAYYTTALPLAWTDPNVPGSEPTVTIGQAPAITSANSTNAFIYSTPNTTFTVVSTGTPTPTLTESGSFPSWATFKDNGDGTATISGTPTAAGTSTFAITAHNGFGNDATQSFSLIVQKADAMINVTSYNVTYDGNPHTATGTSTGVKGEDLSSELDLSHTTHTNAGAYGTDYWAFTDTTGNYNNVAATTITDCIKKANAAISVTPYNVTYDGNPHTAMGTATGVKGEDLSNELDLSHTAHTTAGTYSTDYWAFTDTTGNYNNVAATTITDYIKKANAVIMVTPYSVTYDGNPHTATGTATGVESPMPANLSAGLNLSATTHTDAGTYSTDYWTFIDTTGNYNNVAATTITDSIAKASSTTTVTFESGPYVYRGTAFTASAQIVGVGALASSVGVAYSGDCANVTVTNGCTATATFAGDTNHFGSTDSKSITITQASSMTAVTFEVGPYTYRGTAFTATAAVTGVGGLNQAVSVAYSGDCVNVTTPSGCMATATFAGDTNHTGSTDHKSITITQASSMTSVMFEAGPYTYRGTPFMATAAVMGVGGLSQAVPVLYGGDCLNVTTANGCTATGTYGGDSNHYGSVGMAAITINPATTSTTVSSSPNPSNWGNVVTLTATVANTSTVPAPTGSVSFYNAASGATCSSLGTSTVLDTVQLTTIGTSQQASTSTPNLPVGPGNTVGTDAILACYNFNPADPNYNANLVASNGTTTQTVNPAPIATLVPSSLSFGGQQGGTTSGAQTVTICNGPSGISGSPCFNAPISTAALVVSNIGFTSPNTNPVYFNQTNTCPIGGTGVPVGGGCTSNVKFAPPLNAQGIATALLTVTDNNENVAGSAQSASLIGAGTSAVTGVGSLSTYAIFGTASGCSSVNVSGNGTVDSFGNSNSSGNVGTNGNVTLSGNPVVNGAVYSPIGGAGNCSTKTMTGLSTSGKAQATGGLQALSGPVNYPLPPAPSPAPPTTTQNISGSCGSISGCSNNGSKSVTLAPGQYGNLSISGGTTVNVSGGSYNINSLTLSGNSTLVVTPNTGPVVVNLSGKSLSGGNAALDVSGGSMSNPSGMASNLQVYYAGTQPMKLSGGTGSYAVVYAPNAPINISGGSHFYGSIIGSTVNSSGNTAIHYPTSLAAIGSGNSIWFSSTGLSVKGLPNTGTVKLYVTNASINFTASGTPYNLPVPNAVITFSSTATSASTTWDATNNRWSTLVPMSSVNGNATIHTFFDGVAFQVPAGGFPAGIQNVTWQAAYSTSTTGLSFNWQWGAAVYSTLPAVGATGNYSSFGVNSLDNSVPAGTPVNYEGNLIFGDTGASYTGLYANFVGVVPTIAPMNIAPSSYDFGGVSQGSTATANLAFVLTNNDSVPYTISSIQMTGTYAADFVQTNNCPISPSTLGAGASCTFTVSFTPSTSGGTKETAKIVINDNANNSPQTVFLKGTGQ